ncbi:MAG: response regulator [Planctomycetota bacterium]
MAKIVVLDDQIRTCETIKHRLLADGHEVKTATAGAEAIDLGYLFEPDVLITDLDLRSDYDGFEVATAVLAAKSDVKTILITGHDICRRTPDKRFFARFQKPFSLDKLAESVSLAIAAQ